MVGGPMFYEFTTYKNLHQSEKDHCKFIPNVFHKSECNHSLLIPPAMPSVLGSFTCVPAAIPLEWDHSLVINSTTN
jgi:hypothetical protein